MEVHMSLFKVFAKSYLSLFAIMRVCSVSESNPVSVILFIALVYIFYKIQEDKFEGRIEPRDPALAAILSLLFTCSTIAASYHTIIGSLSSFLFCVIILIMSGLGFLIIYYHLMLLIFQASAYVHITGTLYQYPWFSYAAGAFCFVCWLPYFLFEYPAVMTPDSINQYAQIIGAYELSNHHSVVHTAIIWWFYDRGLALTGDAHFGLALYTLAQMAFMAAAAGYVVKTLQKAGFKTPIIFAAVCFYALIPYNGIFAVTMWKDIPFAGCMAVFCAALVRLLLRPNITLPNGKREKIKVSEYFTLIFPYVFSGIMLCLLRGNGWYAFLASLPFILFVYRSCWKMVVPMNLAVIGIVLFVKYPCMEIYDVRQADFAESISIPAQQLASVIANGGSLSADELEFVDRLMDTQKVAAAYKPDVSDNIKNLIRERGIDYLESHKGEFFKNWFLIGLSNPKLYFDSYVAQTRGYWYPDVACEVGLADGIYPNEFGLSWQPILHGGIVVKIREIFFKLNDLFPVYGAFWSMGLLFWLVLIAAALCIRSECAANSLVCLPLIALVLTLCLAAPVAADFRYAYALAYAMPLFLTAPFLRAEN